MRNFTILKLCFLGLLGVAISLAMLYAGQKWPATLPMGAALFSFCLAIDLWARK